jgi:hypothetical protein
VERGLPNCFNSFAISTKRETVETVPTDRPDTQLKLGVNEKPLSRSLLQFTRTYRAPGCQIVCAALFLR